MKKFFALVLLLLVIATGAFALEITTIGGGGMFNLTNYSLDGGGGNSVKGFGAFGFIGVSEFFEFNLGYINKKNDWDNSLSALMLGALFKYPFDITEQVVLFPSVGLDFEFTLSEWFWDEDYTWHELWLRGGLGIDFLVTENLFLRGHFNYGLGLVIGDYFDDYKFSNGLLIKAGIGYMF